MNEQCDKDAQEVGNNAGGGESFRPHFLNIYENQNQTTVPQI